MIKTPKRIPVTEEIKQRYKQYNYSEFYVFDTDFLEEYKEKIINIFLSEEKRRKIKDNMGSINEFVIGDRIRAGLGRLCCSSTSIHMDISFADITEDSFKLKPGCEYIETIFIHELLHAASKNPITGAMGIEEHVFDSLGRRIGRKNTGLNEGITQFLAEKISGKPVDDSIDSYPFSKKVVSLLVDVLGPDAMMESYFDHTDALKKLMNEVSKDPNYFDEFNKKLDTINRLDITIKRIQRGNIIPTNPDSLAKMEAVVAAQKEALMENFFSKIILPKVQEANIEKRQDILLSLSTKHGKILGSVEKYIPNIRNTELAFEYISDSKITSIQKEIEKYGINFEKILTAAKQINDHLIFANELEKEFIATVDEFYDEKKPTFEKKNNQLTPLLKRELERFVTSLDVLEREARSDLDKENVEGFKKFLKAYFHKIPNLEEEIEKIRQERNIKIQEAAIEKAIPPEIQAIIDEAKKSGEEKAREDASAPPHQNQSENKEQNQPIQNEPKIPRKYTLDDKFVINDITGEIINQSDKSLYAKTKNIAKATGKIDLTNDPVIESMAMNLSTKYVENLTANINLATQQNLVRVYGQNWQQVIKNAYEEGYKMGMKTALKTAENEGLIERKESINLIKEGKFPNELKENISLEELKFAYDNFEIKTKENGETIIVDRVTEQVVISEKTKNMILFADEWIKAVSNNKDISPDLAFSKQIEPIYAFVQAQAKKDLNTIGSIDVSELTINAEAMGDTYQKTIMTLYSNPNTVSIVDKYFRNQNPNAKEPIITSEVELNTDSKKTHK